MDPITGFLALQAKRLGTRLAGRALRWLLPLLVVATLLGVLALGSSVALVSQNRAHADVCQPAPVTDPSSAPTSAPTGALTPEQTEDARIIVQTGLSLDVPTRGLVVAIATALQESNLVNLPGGDRDSVGLFQQRAPWGSFAERTDPVIASTMFYTGGKGGQPGLLDVDGWADLTIAAAAQAVQHSADGSLYAAHEAQATEIVAGIPGTAISGGGACGGGSCPLAAPQQEQNLTPDALALLRCLVARFPQVTSTIGWSDGGHIADSDHYTGKAVDFMLPGSYTDPAMVALGDQMAAWVQDNAATYGVTYVIWNAQIWSVQRASEGWRTYAHPDGRTDPTALHLDHVHVSVQGNAGTYGQAAVTGPVTTPVAAGAYRLTAGFGQCSALWQNCHTGLDFACPTGTPIVAVAAGTVIFTGDGGRYGNLTKIDHGGGVQTWYAHQSAFTVAVGTVVAAGSPIGLVGATGNVTGSHVHLEVRTGVTASDLDGTPIDPRAWLVSKGVTP